MTCVSTLNDNALLGRGIPGLSKLLAQGTRRASLHVLELAVEVRVVSKADVECDIENAQIAIDEKLNGGTDTELIDICRHGPSRGTPEEPAQTRLAHVQFSSQLSKVDFAIKVLMEIGTDLIDPPAIFDPAWRLQYLRRDGLRVGFLSKFDQHRQQRGKAPGRRKRRYFPQLAFDILCGFRISKDQSHRAALEHESNRTHLGKIEQVSSETVSGELDHDGSMLPGMS